MKQWKWIFTAIVAAVILLPLLVYGTGWLLSFRETAEFELPAEAVLARAGEIEVGTPVAGSVEFTRSGVSASSGPGGVSHAGRGGSRSSCARCAMERSRGEFWSWNSPEIRRYVEKLRSRVSPPFLRLRNRGRSWSWPARSNCRRSRTGSGGSLAEQSPRSSRSYCCCCAVAVHAVCRCRNARSGS